MDGLAACFSLKPCSCGARGRAPSMGLNGQHTFWNKSIVYSRPEIIMKHIFKFYMPGQGGDAPGVVILIRKSDNVRLKRKSVEMVQMINYDEVEWKSKSVWIKLFADWELE